MKTAAATWKARGNGTEPAAEAPEQDDKADPEAHGRFVAWATMSKPAGGGMSLEEAEERWAQRF